MFSDSDSALKKFLDETANMSADDRAKHLENNQVGHALLKQLYVVSIQFNIMKFQLMHMAPRKSDQRRIKWVELLF